MTILSFYEFIMQLFLIAWALKDTYLLRRLLLVPISVLTKQSHIFLLASLFCVSRSCCFFFCCCC